MKRGFATFFLLAPLAVWYGVTSVGAMAVAWHIMSAEHGAAGAAGGFLVVSFVSGACLGYVLFGPMTGAGPRTRA
jgi:hypothetical protein